jgi:hypothetical protein
MSLNKTTVVDQITVEQNGVIFFREAISIMENNIELSKTHQHTSLTPAQDLTGIPANVVAICNAAWKPEVVAAYEAAQLASQLEVQPNP